MALEWYYDEVYLIFNGRMSEGDSVGESIHGKPSVVAVFFTRIGQVKCLYDLFLGFSFRKMCLHCFMLYANKFTFLCLNTKKAFSSIKNIPL